MSYSMTHLIIANEYIKNNPVSNTGLFLLANISPDCVHSRKNYTKEMKERSHYLQEGTEWGTILEEEPMKLWYSKLKEFYIERSSVLAASVCDSMNPEAATKASDFLKGYAMHILVDIFNCQLVYAPARKRYGSDLMEFRDEYRNQCLIWDYHLYRSYPDSAKMLAGIMTELDKNSDLMDFMLKQAKLDDVISAGNVSDNFFYNLKQYKQNNKDDFTGESCIITKESSDYFIRYVLEQCDRLLYEFPDVGRLFRIENA